MQDKGARQRHVAGNGVDALYRGQQVQDARQRDVKNNSRHSKSRKCKTKVQDNDAIQVKVCVTKG